MAKKPDDALTKHLTNLREAWDEGHSIIFKKKTSKHSLDALRDIVIRSLRAISTLRPDLISQSIESHRVQVWFPRQIVAELVPLQSNLPHIRQSLTGLNVKGKKLLGSHADEWQSFLTNLSDRIHGINTPPKDTEHSEKTLKLYAILMKAIRTTQGKSERWYAKTVFDEACPQGLQKKQWSDLGIRQQKKRAHKALLKGLLRPYGLEADPLDIPADP